MFHVNVECMNGHNGMMNLKSFKYVSCQMSSKVDFEYVQVNCVDARLHHCQKSIFKIEIRQVILTGAYAKSHGILVVNNKPYDKNSNSQQINWDKII